MIPQISSWASSAAGARLPAHAHTEPEPRRAADPPRPRSSRPRSTSASPPATTPSVRASPPRRSAPTPQPVVASTPGAHHQRRHHHYEDPSLSTPHAELAPPLYHHAGSSAFHATMSHARARRWPRPPRRSSSSALLPSPRCDILLHRMSKLWERGASCWRDGIPFPSIPVKFRWGSLPSGE